jgi:hypothetical protein
MAGHCTVMLRAASLGILLTAVPTLAHARETSDEAIRLTLDAPPSCLVEADLVGHVAALGGHMRTPTERERARTFAVTVAREPDRDRFTARLVVHDLVGQTTERTVTTTRCAEAARSVALLVALALDTETEMPRDTDASATDEEPAAAPTLSFWPAPASDDSPTGGMRITRPRHGRRGSGGLVVTGMYGRSPVPGGGMHVSGVRAYGAMRVASGMRVGASLAVASETQREVIEGSTYYESSGWSARAGAIVGWGAPWSDVVVGFVGEAGIATGKQTGIASPAGIGVTSSACSATRCFDTDRSARSSVRSWSPFAAGSLVLQIPWKAAIRPVAGFTTTATFGSERVASVSVTGDVGFVWQAW